MEADGRKLRKSLYQGSDDVHDFPCSPCAKEGKNVAAAKHCVECDENLCTTCLNDHNKFSLMKGHQLLDKVKTPSGQRIELPSQRCDRHGGKLIDVYCPSHDKVGCSTCIAVEHSTCQGISFIPDVAKHSNSSEKLQQLETAINSLQTRFIALKQKKQKELDCSKREKDKLLHEIKSERKKINDQLDKMETELLNEVDASFKIKVQNIDSDIKKVEDTLASLGKDRQKIQAAKSENVSEKYVQVNLGYERKKIATDRLETLERSKKIGRLWFDPYRQMTGSKVNIIGQVINYSAVEVGSLTEEFDARVGDDNGICIINSIYLCADGDLVLTDYKNKRIKKMNKSYAIISFLNIDDNPFGICQIDMSLLAITLPNEKKVQFISNTEPMRLQKSFDVGDRCRGIAYNDGRIYVCCGGSRKRAEGVGHLEVYTISGALVKSFYSDMECPVKVTVSNWETEIYVCDGYGDLLIINEKHGNTRKIRKQDMKLVGIIGICWINESQLCIVGYTSMNIVLISCDGQVYEELLTEAHGLANTIDVCFDAKMSSLFVSTHRSNMIKVYKLKISNC
ncbi:uncharacterized protein LOC123554477 isoform X2 [Mercenaria mercenaria]|uniref:uncharacterized protein LOC123554477 isoform X2 n=1 Tax=Mercenaria mercenaria TaxID=6596 RepID=UPI00234E421C|nr:uncharacterized protein LOC123554477 isoform X2 [Mercenaria mercenaria]